MKQQSGFTIVELTITLVISALLIGSAYQLFGAISRNSTDAQRQSQASSVAYDLLRRTQNNTTALTNPCTTSTPAASIPSYTNLKGSAQISVSCPLGTTSALSLITVTVTYNNSTGKAQVTRAITTRPS